MFKLVDHIEANRGRMEGKHLKFSIASHPKGPYKHYIVVRVDTGADVNCMNEKTFNELFPEVQLSVYPNEIPNFGNSVEDISIFIQFRTYLEFSGEKYLNTFIVTNANDCPNLLSYGATFRIGELLRNYPEENVVKGDNVPNFSKMNGGRTENGTAHGTSHGTQSCISYVNTGSGTLDGTSNVFQMVPTAPDRNSIQDHHTLHINYDNKTGTGNAKHAKYFMEWTSSTLCTCPQAAKIGFQIRRLVSLEKSPAPAQWKDFCEQTPIDEARHSVTLFWLL